MWLIFVAACVAPRTAPRPAERGEAQLLFRVVGDGEKIDRPVRVRVVVTSGTGLAYDVAHTFPTQASGADIAAFFERSLKSTGFQAFRSTRSVFVEPVHEVGANCSNESVMVTFGQNRADLVKRVRVAKPEAPPDR